MMTVHPGVFSIRYGVARMNSRPTTDQHRYLDDDTRLFVRRVLESKLVDLDEVKRVLRLIMVDQDAFTLGRVAKGLIDSAVITRWQRDLLLRGKKRGFFLGNYKLCKPIGRGAMSVVYLGEHCKIKRRVALKILPPDEAKESFFVQRFRREANIAAQLNHTNVAAVYEYEEVNGKYFMVLEYVDGLNLHEVVQRDGLVSIPQALDLTAQAAKGLDHIHQRGIIHRDVKPTNLIRRHDGVVKVIDMGLAKMGWPDLQGLDSNCLVGTADFVAPEQIVDCRSVDARSDIYSLGCTLYFLLTGRAPYRASTVSQQLAKHQTGEIPDVRATRTDCPDAIAEMLVRMLSKRREDRPRNVQDLIEQLGIAKHSIEGADLKVSLDSPDDTVVS